MNMNQLKPETIVQGPMFPEQVQVITTIPMGASVKLIGTGVKSSKVYEPILTVEQLALLEATPEKPSFDGAPKNFCLFLRLLDQDVHGYIGSLEKAIDERAAPFYPRRVKEALVTFPDPDTGIAKSLFTTRKVHTADFQIDKDELDFYDNLACYVEDQSRLLMTILPEAERLDLLWPCFNHALHPAFTQSAGLCKG